MSSSSTMTRPPAIRPPQVTLSMLVFGDPFAAAASCTHIARITPSATAWTKLLVETSAAYASAQRLALSRGA